MTEPECKDCRAEGITTIRPVRPPGPRCATHRRLHLQAAKQRVRELRLQKVYQITAAEYSAIYQAQGGRCYLCRIATGKTKALAVDHDHTTGEVRALLCGPCNKILGHSRDSSKFFERAIEYLGWYTDGEPTFTSRVLGRRVYVGTAPVKGKP